MNTSIPSTPQEICDQLIELARPDLEEGMRPVRVRLPFDPLKLTELPFKGPHLGMDFAELCALSQKFGEHLMELFMQSFDEPIKGAGFSLDRTKLQSETWTACLVIYT